MSGRIRPLQFDDPFQRSESPIPIEAPRSSGSFFIPIHAVEALLNSGKEARWLIPAYLKFAAYTDHAGKYSTAGHTAIRRALRRNKEDALKITAQLVDMGLLFTAKQWEKKTKEFFPQDVPEKRKVRYVLNHFDERPTDMVWFGRGIVDGVGEMTDPLRRLADCGPAGAKMLLYLHREYDQHVFHACNPLTTLYVRYLPVKEGEATNYMINAWQRQSEVMTGNVLNEVFPEKKSWDELKEKAEWDERETHWDAYYNLLAAGFIYEVAAVVSTPIKVKSHEYDGKEYIGADRDYGDMENMGLVYPLANLDRFADTQGLLQEAIRATLERLGKEVTPSYVYSILPTGATHSVMGLYRPRFNVENLRNAHVADAAEAQRGDTETAMRWLGHFRRTKGLD